MPGIGRAGSPARSRVPHRPGTVAEQSAIVDHTLRNGKCPAPVFLPEQINAVLDSDTGVCLGQCGGGEPDQPDSAVSDRGRESDSIQDRSTANHHDIAAAVRIGVMHACEHPFDDVDVVFDGFSARRELDIAGQFDKYLLVVSQHIICAAEPMGEMDSEGNVG